jgi:two-component system response regulator RegA
MQKEEMTAAAGPAGRRILLVDDDAPLRRNLVRALVRSGFVVAAVGTLKEAFAAATEEVPDYALLDLNLEDGYGMELVDTLRDMNPGCRIVILTGYDSIASSVLALKAGAVDYLAKPVAAEAVVAALVNAGAGGATTHDMPMSADRVRWEHIQRVFEQCDRNVSETARRLGMHRRTLQRILSKRAPR